MSVCRFIKSMSRWRSRVRLIVRQAVLACPSVRPTTLVRSIGVVFDVARQIHVATMVGPAHYHVLASSAQRFRLRLCDNLSLPHCTARKQGCFVNHGCRRQGRRSWCRPSSWLGRFLSCLAPHDLPFRHRRARSSGPACSPHCISFTHRSPRPLPCKTRHREAWKLSSASVTSTAGCQTDRAPVHIHHLLF